RAKLRAASPIFLTRCLPASLIIGSPLRDFRGGPSSGRTAAASSDRLQPSLKVEHAMALGTKAAPVRYLGAIRSSFPRRGAGSSRVGQPCAAGVTSRFVPKRFPGPPLRRADLSPERRGRGLACAYC